MLKLIVYFVAAVAVISGEVTEKTDEVEQEHGNVREVVEQRSSFPAQSGCEHEGVSIPSSWYDIHDRYYPVTSGGIFSPDYNGIPDPAEISPFSKEGWFIPNFRRSFVESGSVPFPFSDIYNPFKFPPHNGVVPSYFNFNNGLYNPFEFPHYISSPYYNPIISLLYNKYSPYFGGVFSVVNNGAAFQPDHSINHLDSIVHHYPGHVVHKPEIVSTVSETVSVNLPHGEEVIKETSKEITSNLHENPLIPHGGVVHNGIVPPHTGVVPPYFSFINGLYKPFKFPHYTSSPYYNPIMSLLYNKDSPYFGGVFPVVNTGAAFQPGNSINHVDSIVHHDPDHVVHKPEIVSTVSKTVSETLPHGEEVIKETTQEITSNLHENPLISHEPVVVNSVSHVISESGPHGEVVQETKEVTSNSHIPHVPEVVNSVSHVISESGPHGEVVQETKEVTSNSHLPHVPEVVNLVSHVISESGPHGEVVKETEEITSHSENNFHGNELEHGHGYKHHLPNVGNVIQGTKDAFTNQRGHDFYGHGYGRRFGGY